MPRSPRPGFEQSEDSDSVIEGQKGERIHDSWYVLGILHTYLILKTQRDGNYYLHLADEETNIQRGCYLLRVIIA